MMIVTGWYVHRTAGPRTADINLQGLEKVWQRDRIGLNITACA